jgi:hypothetical protein
MVDQGISINLYSSWLWREMSGGVPVIVSFNDQIYSKMAKFKLHLSEIRKFEIRNTGK